MIYGWTIGIGDPGALGWATVAAYFVAAALCWLTARQPRNIATRRLWTIVAVALLLLGVNKQLDLQSLLTAVARHVTQVMGWYGERRFLQIGFITAVGLAGAGAAMMIVRNLDRYDGAARTACLGCIALLVFVLARAASFHHVDGMLAGTALGIRLNHVLELGGIGAIALGASLALMRRTAAR